MLQSLKTINELLNGWDIPSIDEVEARKWDIEGGESFEELHEMAKCFRDELHAKFVEALHYIDTVVF